MASLINSTEKSDIQSVFRDIHDTFKKEILVFIEESQGLPTDPSTHNPLFGNDGSTSTNVHDKILTKYVISGRFNPIDETKDNRVANSALPLGDGGATIKVDVTGKGLVEKSKHLEIEGSLYTRIGGATPIGPFDAEFYSFTIQLAN